MKNNLLFLSREALEKNLHYVYRAFYILKPRMAILEQDLVVLLMAEQTVRQLAESLDISRQAVHMQLKKIKSKGWLIEKKMGKSGVYQLNEMGMAEFHKAMEKSIEKLSSACQSAGSDAAMGFAKVLKELEEQHHGKKY